MRPLRAYIPLCEIKHKYSFRSIKRMWTPVYSLCNLLQEEELCLGRSLSENELWKLVRLKQRLTLNEEKNTNQNILPVRWGKLHSSLSACATTLRYIRVALNTKATPKGWRLDLILLSYSQAKHNLEFKDLSGCRGITSSVHHIEGNAMKIYMLVAI